MNLSLSICYIVKNEEANIGLSLESIKDIASEIIIVDTGSTDNTKLICQQFGAKIYDFEWSDDFSQARNYSIKFATQEWVLVFDADFILEKNSKELLQKYLNSNNSLYYIRCLEDNTGIEHPLLLLFKNNHKFYFSGRIHEQLVFDKNKFKPVYSEILIRHTGYIDPDLFNKKIERNNKILQLALNDNNLTPLERLRLSVYLLRNKIHSFYNSSNNEIINNKNFDKLSIEILEFNEQIIKNQRDIIIYSQLFESFFIDSLNFFLLQKDYSLFEKSLKVGIDIFPTSINLLYLLADHLLRKENYFKNIEILEFIAYLIYTKNSSIYLFTTNNKIKSIDYIYKTIINSYYQIGDYKACKYYLEKIKDESTLKETNQVLSDKTNLINNLEKEIIVNPTVYIYYRLAREYLNNQVKPELIKDNFLYALKINNNRDNDLFILIITGMIENNFREYEVNEKMDENPYYCFCLGQYYFYQQEYNNSLKYFEKAIKLQKEITFFSNHEANLLLSESRFKSYFVNLIFKQIKTILSIISQSKL